VSGFAISPFARPALRLGWDFTRMRIPGLLWRSADASNDRYTMRTLQSGMTGDGAAWLVANVLKRRLPCPLLLPLLNYHR
jgi:hypothetical protein